MVVCTRPTGKYSSKFIRQIEKSSAIKGQSNGLLRWGRVQGRYHFTLMYAGYQQYISGYYHKLGDNAQRKAQGIAKVRWYMQLLKNGVVPFKTP